MNWPQYWQSKWMDLQITLICLTAAIPVVAYLVWKERKP